MLHGELLLGSAKLEASYLLRYRHFGQAFPSIMDSSKYLREINYHAQEGLRGVLCFGWPCVSFVQLFRLTELLSQSLDLACLSFETADRYAIYFEGPRGLKRLESGILLVFLETRSCKT